MALKRRSANVLGAVLLIASLTASGGGHVQAQVPAIGRPLPIAGFHSIVVDPVHDVLFVSGGQGTAGVLVLDYAGNVVKHIEAPGASGMVLVGRRLYVASRDHSTIDVIDTADLERMRRYSLNGLSEPEFLGAAGKNLWVTHGPCQDDAGMASVHIQSGRVKRYSRYAVDPYYCPELVTNPVDPGLLWAWERGISPVSLLEYDVASGRARLVKDHWDVSFPLSDVHFSPDGLTFLTRGYGVMKEHRVFNLTSFGSYQATSDSAVVATAYSRGGSHVAAADEEAEGAQDVYLFAASEPQAKLSFDLLTPLGDAQALPRGLAFSDDASTLFVISRANEDEIFFHALPTNVQESSLRLRTSRSRVTRGRPTRVTAHLEVHEESANREIKILAVTRSGRRDVIKRGKVDSNGNVSVTESPGRHTFYIAKWSGDSSYSSSTAAVVVHVRARVRAVFRRAYARVGRYLLFHPRPNPLYVARVLPRHAGRRVHIAFQSKRRGSWSGVSESFKVRSDGSVGVLFPGRYMLKGVPFRTRTTFRGDRDHLGAKSRWSYWKITR